MSLPDAAPRLAIVHLDRVGSTIDHARLAIEEGRLNPERPALAAIAREQTGGRGRRGDAWLSPPGGLWLTLAWRPPGRAPANDAIAAALALSAARAAEAAIDAPRGAHLIRVKPPNDLLVGHAKLAGCIAQVISHSGHDYVLASLGMNVNNDPRPLAAGLGREVASLCSLAGAEVDLDRLARAAVTGLLALLERGLSDAERVEFEARMKPAGADAPHSPRT